MGDQSADLVGEVLETGLPMAFPPQVRYYVAHSLPACAGSADTDRAAQRMHLVLADKLLANEQATHPWGKGGPPAMHPGRAELKRLRASRVHGRQGTNCLGIYAISRVARAVLFMHAFMTNNSPVCVGELARQLEASLKNFGFSVLHSLCVWVYTQCYIPGKLRICDERGRVSHYWLNSSVANFVSKVPSIEIVWQRGMMPPNDGHSDHEPIPSELSVMPPMYRQPSPRKRVRRIQDKAQDL